MNISQSWVLLFHIGACLVDMQVGNKTWTSMRGEDDDAIRTYVHVSCIFVLAYNKGRTF
jgi:hypothetical protein